ncbi:lysoplasmalogenase family protein [uncultured Tenacibaculum sp.]|uniref:lysoplasmalogenase family protein n=1 Tax=uncultured Tenacibaculum sp. TaxID=174713 RepID=UPI0026171E00|nr:lysoplasmalogenase family protein [uncultured Tenacibaculum sp.]
MVKSNINKKNVIFFTALYLIASLLVLYVVTLGDLNVEFAVKLAALLSLSFLYLETTPKVNYWYVIILLFSILSDSLFVFEEHFFYAALSLLIVNRFIYIIIIHPSVLKYPVRSIIIYAIPFVFIFSMIYLILYEYIVEIQFLVFLMGVVSISLILFAFLNLLTKNNRKAIYFFVSTLLFPFADIITIISAYIEQHWYYVVIYHFLYYVGRYLMYKSMILKK